MHTAGGAASDGALSLRIDDDGVARFQAVRPTQPGAATHLLLDCTDAEGLSTSQRVDLTSEETFAPHPFDPVRAHLEARPALVEDPLSLSQGELVGRGYGLRPDPIADRASYDRWLSAARRPMYELRGTVEASRPVARSSTHAARTKVTPDVSVGDGPNGWFYWTGPQLTGEYQAGVSSYAASYASFAVPAVTPGGTNGVGATVASMWNGLGGGGLFQAELEIESTATASTYLLQTQCFAAPSGQGSRVSTFKPAVNDEISSQLWYCDKNGYATTTGGYACTYMVDYTQNFIWRCDQASDSNCPSYPVASPDGTSAEFIIENQDSQIQGYGVTNGPWPFFAPAATMTTSAEVAFANNQRKIVTVGNDPFVTLLQDFTTATNADHLAISLVAGTVLAGAYDPGLPASVTWRPVTGAVPPLPSAPGCTYAGTIANGNGILTVNCPGATLGDDITLAEQKSDGSWEYFAVMTPGVQSSWDMGANAAPVTLLACSANSSWGWYSDARGQVDVAPVAPGDIGCDPSPTTVTFAAPPPPVCVPSTKACVGDCGTASDGCGGYIGCGDCPSGTTCDGITCIPNSTCPTTHRCFPGFVWDDVNCTCECVSARCQGGGI